MENERTMNKSIGIFSEKVDLIQAILLGLIAFLAPTFFAGAIKEIFGAQSVVTTNSQLIVGSIVNTALIVAAINVKGWKKIVGIVTMPSISTILSGYVFKSASPFMAYMIPAIWVGNFALIYAYKLIMLAKGKNYFLAGAIGVIAKVLIIFSIFNLLKVFGVFPEKIATVLSVAMGKTQAITATIGVLISFIIYGIEKRKVK